MEKVTLYSEERSDIKIVMHLLINDKGQLIFDGCDTGSFVKQTFGDFDYEYMFTVEPKEVEKFCPLFNIPKGNPRLLLACLKDRFSNNYAYSQMKEFMTNNGIRYEVFIWR